MNEPSGPGSAPGAPHRRRWKRWLLLGLIALVALIALAPLYLGPMLRGVVVRQIERNLAARAQVQTVSFSWPARLHVRGVELDEPDGAPLATLDDLHASLELLPLLAGDLRADVALAYPELHVARTGDGRWNWERALAEAPAREEEAEEEKPEEGDELPDVEARLRIVDGHVVIHGPGGDTTLSDIALDLDVQGLEQPAPFRLATGVRGPHGEAGAVTLEGSFTAAREGRMDALTLAADARLALESLDLSGFAPAIALVAPVEELGGVLDGKAEFTLGVGLALSGTGDVELRDLVVRGPREGAEPARIERAELRARASQQGEGAGTQHLELTAGSFLALVYDGRSDLASDAGSLAGTLTLSGDLARLSELARGWMPLQEGVALRGRVEHVIELEAALAERRPTSARVRAHGGVEDLAAQDARGRALDLGELEEIGLELDASADLVAGTLSVPAFAVRAGPLVCEGRLEAAGLARDARPGGLELRTGALRLEADLERLRGTLAQIVDLADFPFGGRLEADVTLGGRDEALELSADVQGSSLAFGGTSLSEVRGDLRAARAADGSLDGSGRLQLGTLGLALAGREPLALPGSVLSLTLREDSAGKGEHSLGLETSDGALELALTAHSQRDEDGLALRTSLALEGQVARLAELAAPLVPVRPGLAGDLRVTGELDAALSEGALASAGGRIELVLSGLSVRDSAGQVVSLEALGQTTLALEGALDAREGSAELRSLALRAGGLDLRGSGRARRLDGGKGALELEDGRIELEADLTRLGAELARVVDLGGWAFSGSPLEAKARVASAERRIEAKGRLGAATLVLARPEGTPLELAELGLEFDLGYDAELGSLHVRRASARSRTATLELAGTLNDLGDPTEARGAMQLDLRGELERMLADLGLEPPASGRRTSGALAGKFALEGDRGSFRLTGGASIERFRLELAPAAEGEPPLVVEEPSIALDCEARVDLAALDVDLGKLTLASGLARGGAEGRIENLRSLSSEDPLDAVRFVGLKGELAYVPERLGAVLAPFLPGKLTGSEEQRVTFALDGSASELDLLALLAGSEARVDLGIGRFERPEIQLGGALALAAKDQRLGLNGDLTANGGTLKLDATLDLGAAEEGRRSELDVAAKGVRVNAGFAPLLALVHPAFATAELAQGALDGVLALTLDLRYEAPLSIEQLRAGWKTLPKEPIQGMGRLELSSLSLQGSQLLAMLSEFGVKTTEEIELRPIEFTVQNGRITYAKPWTWTLAGTPTTFTGSVGLDESLDLAWNVPITDALIDRFGFLSALEGETLSIPVRGSVRRPRLDAEDLMKDLAAKAAKSELESRLGLGNKSGDDPASLLERADELWGQGKKTEAAALYTRLREEYKLSLVYALNKDRIRDRSKYKEPPR